MHSTILNRIFVAVVVTLSYVGFVHTAHVQTTSAQATKSDRLINAPRLPMLLLSDFRSDAGNDPMIKCRIGERSYWFSIDTAMSFSVLKRSVQQEAGLATENHPDFDVTNLDESDKPFLIDGKVLKAKARFIARNITLVDFPFTLSNDDQVGALTIKEDRSVAGIVGADFLRRFAVLFDYDNRQLRLIAEGNATSEERRALGFDANDGGIDLKPFAKDANVLGLKVRCNGKEVTLALDTGMNVTMLQKSARDLGVKLPDAADSKLSGFFGERDAKSADVSVSVGGLSPQILETAFLEGDQKVDFLKEGTLGRDFLMRYNFLIDFPAKKLYLRPRTDLKRDQ